MNMHKTIEKILNENLNITHLDVINDSHHHQGHAGDDGSGQTHFTIHIDSEDLTGLSRVHQHRKINELLKPCMEQGLHALSIQVQSSKQV